MKKVISLLLVIITVTLLLCSCGRMGKVIEAYNDASTVKPAEPAESVDEVALGVETYLATTTHDIGRYAMFQVEGKIVSDEKDVRTWLVCYLDNDGDVNWYIVTWDGKRYEKYAFQSEG